MTIYVNANIVRSIGDEQGKSGFKLVADGQLCLSLGWIPSTDPRKGRKVGGCHGR